MELNEALTKVRDEYVRLNTPEEAVLGLLCEECGEVVKAAAKLERILRKESPTPETEEEWREKLHEEINDVFNIARVLGLKEDRDLQQKKMKRWCDRIEAERGEEKEAKRSVPVYKIPKEYTHDAALISAYNRGYQHGYSGDPTPWAMKTDEERLAYANGRREGQLRKKAEEGQI